MTRGSSSLPRTCSQALLAGALLFLVPAATSAQQPLDIARTTAQQAEARGDLRAAYAAYLKAIQLVRQENKPEILADVSLKYARVCELGAAEDDPNVFPIDVAERVYREVIQIGTPPQRLLAQNNLGNLLLRQGKPSEALSILRQMDLSSLQPSERFVYEYNTARAFEATGNSTAAVELYQKVFTAQPAFEPAIEAAFRVLRLSRPAPVQSAAGLANLLVERGQAELVAPQVRKLLQVWAREREAQRLLAVLVRCYAEQSLDPATFEKSEWPVWNDVRARAPGLALAVRQVRSAFLDRLEPFFRSHMVPEVFSAWSGQEWKVKPFGLLLRSLGHHFRHGDPRAALARYSLAWSMNNEDVEAALYAADVLLNESRSVDPQGRQLDQFIDNLFMLKGEAYLGNDWLNILRLHTVLGTIFARQEKWGPADSPRSAVFQFVHALRAEDNYRRKNPGFPPAAGLHQQLGHAYLRLNRTQDALSEFIRAGEGFVKDSREEEAREMLTRAQALRITPDTRQHEKLKRLATDIDKLPRSRP